MGSGLLVLALAAIAGLLAVAILAAAIARRSAATAIVYNLCLAASVALLSVGGAALLAGNTAAAQVQLPLGLPWIGVHLRVDSLAAFFLVVVNVGGAAASFFALGHGQHEREPERVLPFYPVYL